MTSLPEVNRSFDTFESYRLYQKNVSELSDVQVVVVCKDPWEITGEHLRICAIFSEIHGKNAVEENCMAFYEAENSYDDTNDIEKSDKILDKVEGLFCELSNEAFNKGSSRNLNKGGVVVYKSILSNYGVVKVRAVLDKTEMILFKMGEVFKRREKSLGANLVYFDRYKKGVEILISKSQNNPELFSTLMKLQEVMKASEKELMEIHLGYAKECLGRQAKFLESRKAKDNSSNLSFVVLKFSTFKHDISLVPESLKDYKFVVFVPKDAVEKSKAGLDAGDRKDAVKSTAGSDAGDRKEASAEKS